MQTLKNKTVFITGATRGIGHAIAMRCALDGANVVITGKTAEPHPKLKGTIFSVAEEVAAKGGKPLPIQLDVRSEEEIEAAVTRAVTEFGGIDILVNNASAISLTSTVDTTMKRFDLMFNVNVRATFACSKFCIPYLSKAENPHILTLSPPINLNPKWFKNHVAYTMSKYGMSMCTLGMAEELKNQGIAVNSLWPRTTIATAAIEAHFPESFMQSSRKPEIMADAAYYILTSDAKTNTGNFYVDEHVLIHHGVIDLDKYAVKSEATLIQDLFLD